MAKATTVIRREAVASGGSPRHAGGGVAYTEYMYTFADLQADMARLARLGAAVYPIGQSVLGHDILCAETGAGDPKIIVTGGIHARENVSARLVARQAFDAAGRRLPGRIYFVPMLNPDGALLIEKGAGIAGEGGARLIEINGGSTDFSLWKANIRAVDLNVNFDARWGTGASNIRYPAPANYIGPEPFSEPETRAIAAFTVRIGADLTLSYHALGREIYWYFYQKRYYDRDLATAEYIDEQLKIYRLGEDRTDSAGGYKDWCVAKLLIQAFTIELVGVGTHPLPDDAADYDYELNKNLPEKLLYRLRGG